MSSSENLPEIPKGWNLTAEQRASMIERQKKVIDLDTYSALDAYAISLNEYYRSLRKAGFTETHAFWLMSDRESYPDWILPVKPLEKISGNDYEDDEDDD